MKPKFTPGPWGIFKGECGGFVVDELNEREPKNSKTPFMYCELALVSEDQTKPKIANARLIAAAPDLYQALVMVLDEFSDQSSAVYLTTELEATLKAALAKANGEDAR